MGEEKGRRRGGVWTLSCRGPKVSHNVELVRGVVGETTLPRPRRGRRNPPPSLCFVSSITGADAAPWAPRDAIVV